MPDNLSNEPIDERMIREKILLQCEKSGNDLERMMDEHIMLFQGSIEFNQRTRWVELQKVVHVARIARCRQENDANPTVLLSLEQQRVTIINDLYYLQKYTVSDEYDKTLDEYYEQIKTYDAWSSVLPYSIHEEYRVMDVFDGYKKRGVIVPEKIRIYLIDYFNRKLDVVIKQAETLGEYGLDENDQNYNTMQSRLIALGQPVRLNAKKLAQLHAKFCEVLDENLARKHFKIEYRDDDDSRDARRIYKNRLWRMNDDLNRIRELGGNIDSLIHTKWLQLQLILYDIKLIDDQKSCGQKSIDDTENLIKDVIQRLHDQGIHNPRRLADRPTIATNDELNVAVARLNDVYHILNYEDTKHIAEMVLNIKSHILPHLESIGSHGSLFGDD